MNYPIDIDPNDPRNPWNQSDAPHWERYDNVQSVCVKCGELSYVNEDCVCEKCFEGE